MLIRDILCIHNRIRFITLIIIWNIIVLSNDGRISFILENKILQNFLCHINSDRNTIFSMINHTMSLIPRIATTLRLNNNLCRLTRKSRLQLSHTNLYTSRFWQDSREVRLLTFPRLTPPSKRNTKDLINFHSTNICSKVVSEFLLNTIPILLILSKSDPVIVITKNPVDLIAISSINNPRWLYAKILDLIKELSLKIHHNFSSMIMAVSIASSIKINVASTNIIYFILLTHTINIEVCVTIITHIIIKNLSNTVDMIHATQFLLWVVIVAKYINTTKRIQKLESLATITISKHIVVHIKRIKLTHIFLFLPYLFTSVTYYHYTTKICFVKSYEFFSTSSTYLSISSLTAIS